MMSDDDDFDFSATKKSSNNLATLFHGGEPVSSTPVATTAYVAPKQPKKDSAPRIMVAGAAQVFSFGADQKWTQKGKMGVAILSTENTIFQLILYIKNTQPITSVRIYTTTTFTAQSENYLSFQDDGGQNWSVMFENKQSINDFALQILVAKAFLFAFKFDYIVQDIRDGESTGLVDGESVEVTVNTYKFIENGTIQSTDSGDNKPVRFKVGKQQNGKAFDDVLRGMKKGAQRAAMIGKVLYSIEVVRIKREKEARSSSVTEKAEEPVQTERKRTIHEDDENDDKNRMLQRINKMGGKSMIHNPSQASAFAHPHHLSDDDSINNEYIQHGVPSRSIPTPGPPIQFVQPGYHPHHPQTLMQHPHLYPPQQQQPQPPPQPLYDYTNRPGSSASVMGYQQHPMWPQSQYPPPTPNMPPMDMFYQQQQQPQQPPFQLDVRQLVTRLNEKVDVLNEKFDTKIITTHPNMETSILLANIQRIVKENETVKKDLFDRSAKIEELNLKISDLLDRNQKLIEQSHLTAEQRNVVVNTVSEHTATKILELEKQKVELTNNLSEATSKISELQLQLNQFNQGSNENQSRITTLSQKCEQYKEELQKSENQRSEIQTKFETVHEQYKNEKTTRKQLQANLNTLEEELAETKINYTNLQKGINERKTKYENERKRWQDDVEDQKQTYEKELDELRAKLRKQRTNENLTNNQEISRIEEDLGKEWQEKLERQQAQYERLLNTKSKEFEQLKALFIENETKLEEINEELNESKQQIEVYEERCERFQERLVSMKEKLVEMTEEQPELINEQVKRAISIIFQRLKTRIQPTKQYTGEQFLTRSLEIIKKATLKVLSNDDENDEQSSASDIQSDHENENENEKVDDQPINGNSVDQQSLTEAISSIQTEQTELTEQTTTVESEVLSTTSQKNGWDTVDDLQQETNTQIIEQNQNQNQESTPADNQTEINPLNDNNQPISSTENVQKVENDSDGTADTIEENDEQKTQTQPPPPPLETPKEKSTSDDDSDDALFTSARPSIQDPAPPPAVTQPASTTKFKFQQNIPLLSNPDDSDDEIFK